MSDTGNGNVNEAAAVAAAGAAKKTKQPRQSRNFPAATFEEALELPLSIQRIGSGEKVRRLTLFC